MKMPKDQYNRIKTGISDMLDRVGPAEVEAYKGRVNPEHFRWGLYWRTYPGGIKHPDDINDNHIDTALRRIVRELGL